MVRHIFSLFVLFSLLFQVVHADISDWKQVLINEQSVTHMRNTIARLSVDELAGAVLMPSFEKGMTEKRFGALLCDLKARSYIILRKDTSKAMIDSIQKAYTHRCPKTSITLRVALDAEPSLMKYRLPSIKIEETALLTTEAKVRHAAETIAAALKSRGITINFAPVYDRGTNKEIIAQRSFAPSAGAFPNLFSAITWDTGVVPTAKHFPGHGMVTGDSHIRPVVVNASHGLPELDEFKYALAAGVPFVMVGHITVKGGEWDSEDLPSTLSKKIMTDLLRNTLQFKGLIVTDSMAMGALQAFNDRSVRALRAGADLIDPRAAHRRVKQTLLSDVDFKKNIIESISRAELIMSTLPR
jgi:beta-N-acetylhexosaminidase